MQWYVISKRSGEIVNAISTFGNDKPRGMEYFPEELYTITDTPTQAQLDNYVYYRERP